MRRASILNIGTELLVGHTLNTHANYLSRELNEMGYAVYYHFTVGDNMERIKGALKFLKDAHSDLIIITGGLGPTEDDITRQAVAEFAGLPLIRDEESVIEIDRHFAARGRRPAKNNYLQALFPQNSIIIRNARGTAPGFLLNADGVGYACLPGPPRELYWMFPHLIELLQKGEEKLYSKFICLSGIGESDCAELIDDIFMNQTDPSIGIYAAEGVIKLRLSSFKKTVEEAEKAFKPVVEAIEDRIGDYIFSLNNESPEEALNRVLSEKGYKIAFAESMTGGFMAKKLTDVPGASEVFEMGEVTYSDRAKTELLGVDASLIEKHGAVSKEVALAMNEGLAEVSGADVCVSVTGYASKYEGIKEDEVGLFYIAYKICDKIFVKEYRQPGERALVRTLAVNRAFIELLKSL